MIEHHIQRQILHNLVKGRSTFSELKPEAIEGNLFTYHLQQLIAHGYIEKLPGGGYAITSTGKLEGIHLGSPAKAQLNNAHSIILLAVRDSAGSWLLRRRLVEPLRGKIGFLHGEPMAGVPVLARSQQILEQRTGLDAEFTVRGSGYVSQSSHAGLESFSHFTLLSATIDHAELNPADETGENIWVSTQELSTDSMLASMQPITELLDKTPETKLFFTDLHYDI